MDTFVVYRDNVKGHSAIVNFNLIGGLPDGTYRLTSVGGHKSGEVQTVSRGNIVNRIIRISEMNHPTSIELGGSS